MRGRDVRTIALVLTSCSCVTTVSDRPPPEEAAPLDLRPVVVPLGGGMSAGHGAVAEYYGSILAQMQESLLERDLGRLRGLLSSHDRSDAPAWAQQRIAGFRHAAAGLAFEVWAARATRIRVQGDGGHLGDRLELSIELGGAQSGVRGALAAERVEVGVDSDSTGVLVHTTLLDTDAFGNQTARRASQVLRFDRPVDLAQAAVALPVRIDGGVSGAAWRDITVRVFLLPGMTWVDGVRCPVVGRVPGPQVLAGTAVPAAEDAVARWTLTRYPAGVEPIRDQPMRTLRNALTLRSPAYARQQYLAARFMPAAERDAAIELLVPRVRLGHPEEARLAMACLQRLTGEAIPVQDREAWLAWWQRRQSRDD